MARLYDRSAWRHRVAGLGKYILPGACLLPDVRPVPAPVEQLTFAELEARFPDRVHTLSIGVDPPQSATQFRVTEHGRSYQESLLPTTPAPVVIHTIDGGGSVGRACSLIGPERTAVRETGFSLDRGLAGPCELRKLDPRYWQHRHRGDVTARFRLPEPEHVPGRVVVLNNRQSHNFYHWLVEVAPRIAAVNLADLDVAGYLVDHQCGYQQRVLEMLGIPEPKWIQPHARLHLTADHLLWVSQPGETLLRHFVRMLEPAVQAIVDLSQNRRLYISRRRATHRRLTNERELEHELEKLGFEIHCFEDIPFERQASLMREASLIVTVHGAALANAMFARPGTGIVEIYPQRRSHRELYPHWSRLHGFDHHVVMASCSKFRQRLTVPIPDVLDAVRASMGRAP
jgi:hypothetical protein